MKGFEREDLYFSLCGLNCGLCPMQLDKGEDPILFGMRGVSLQKVSRNRGI